MFAIRYQFPEIRDEVPKNFKRAEFLIRGLLGLNGFGTGTHERA